MLMWKEFHQVVKLCFLILELFLKCKNLLSTKFSWIGFHNCSNNYELYIYEKFQLKIFIIFIVMCTSKYSKIYFGIMYFLADLMYHNMHIQLLVNCLDRKYIGLTSSQLRIVSVLNRGSLKLYLTFWIFLLFYYILVLDFLDHKSYLPF